jgi:dTMP kinase
VTFIVVEGGEGVGKSTQVERLTSKLRSLGRSVDQTREPGGTPAGVELRERLLHGGAVDSETELGWFLEDRQIHVDERIRPNLERGLIVVCDRFSPSTIVYQGVARGMGVDYVETRCREATNDVVPDVVLVLDLADDIAETRVAPSRDRLEREGAAFHAVVRQAFRDLAAGRGWVLVDASGSPEEVAARVWAIVEPML